jgi:hypothetical protein
MCIRPRGANIDKHPLQIGYSVTASDAIGMSPPEQQRRRALSYCLEFSTTHELNYRQLDVVSRTELEDVTQIAMPGWDARLVVRLP